MRGQNDEGRLPLTLPRRCVALKACAPKTWVIGFPRQRGGRLSPTFPKSDLAEIERVSQYLVLNSILRRSR